MYNLLRKDRSQKIVHLLLDILVYPHLIEIKSLANRHTQDSDNTELNRGPDANRSIFE